MSNLEAKFSFTDRDGHTVKAAPDPCGRIVDTLKPITITIMHRESR